MPTVGGVERTVCNLSWACHCWWWAGREGAITGGVGGDGIGIVLEELIGCWERGSSVWQVEHELKDKQVLGYN